MKIVNSPGSAKSRFRRSAGQSDFVPVLFEQNSDFKVANGKGEFQIPGLLGNWEKNLTLDLTSGF